MKRALFAAVALAVLPALAPPQPSKNDPHIKTVGFTELDRTLLVGAVGRVSDIEFRPDEQIERVIWDDVANAPCLQPGPDAFKDAPLKNNLPVRCTQKGETGLLVITLRPDGSERTYNFLVRAEPAPNDGDDAAITYHLKFTYPDDIKAAQAQVAVKALAVRERKQKAVAEARLAVDPFYGSRRWKGIAIGDRTIAPSGISDNGMLTVLRFPGNTKTPSVFVVDSGPWCDPAHPPPTEWLHAPEATASVDSQDDFLVLHQTAAHLRLRLGPQHVLDISNCGYDPVGRNPGTGTSSPDVVREVLAK